MVCYRLGKYLSCTTKVLSACISRAHPPFVAITIRVERIRPHDEYLSLRVKQAYDILPNRRAWTFFALEAIPHLRS